MTDDRETLDARYRALFETTPDGIAILDEAGIYIDLNDSMCRMLGAPREALIGRHFRDFIPANRLHQALAEFARLQASGGAAVEFPVQRGDGTVLNLEWRCRANFVPGLHLCVARDLGPTDAAQRALRESDDRYRAFVANSSEAIWRFELEQPHSIDLPPEQQIDHWYRHAYLAECNEAMARMYGLDSVDDLVGVRLEQILVRDDPSNVAYLQAFITSGYRLVGAESHELDRDGNEKFFVNSLVGVVENGMLLRAWGTQRDATEHRRIENDRNRLLARLEFLADMTAALGSSLDYDKTLQSIAHLAVPRFADWCVVDLVDASGSLKRVAAAHSEPAKVARMKELERSFPLLAEARIGPPHAIRTGNTQTHIVTDALLQSVARSTEHFQMLRSFGFRHALVVPLWGHDRTVGALTFINAESERHFAPDDVALAEDIGRRAGLAIENARLYGDLERASRAKDEFLAMLSHELRTPMTATLGWATMLQMGTLPPDILIVAAEAIAQSTRSQARLIDDLLDISRIVAGKMQLAARDVKVLDTIAAAVETVRPAADAKQIQVEIDILDRDVRVHGDPERLQQVLWNLLSNAVKFTPRGGAVKIELSRAGGMARVVVRDSGEGIPSELLPHIFERFRQGESGAGRKHGGLGLGLSIARNLVELHGGTLTASSGGSGHGAELTVLLPEGKETHDVSGPAAEAVEAPLNGLSLLLVEDDDATRRMLEIALRHYGAEVASVGAASNAFEALSKGDFDLLLSDIGLPGEDGCSLIRRVRETNNSVSAIALTAYASDGERERALAAGFQAWLAKPIDPARLAEEVLRLVR